MIPFLLRRVVWMLPTLLGVSVVVFVTVKLIPGDPVAAMAGPGATPEAVADLKARLALDSPAHEQYFAWLGHAVTGDLGESITHHQETRPLVWDAFVNTAVLTGLAALFAAILGVGLGVLGAVRPRGLIGRLCSATAVTAVSAPQYSVALVFMTYLALRTGWFPVSGMHSVGETGIADLLHHAFLPALTASLVCAGVLARMCRATLLDTMSEDFVEALRARGLPERRVVAHALHNTVPSLLTVAGLQLGYLVGGVVFVETVFSWPGIGLLVYQSISTRDLPVIQAGVLLTAVALVVANLLVDAARALLDPRLRKA
ncbi:ABC transporter permease [Yinghuangia sp. YIM S09857]|uniref:ABC transporter permease n=1 Tax=Yinghuangia sp. YIM S09857 TaxID=3436929 RepID=UPI003F53912F